MKQKWNPRIGAPVGRIVVIYAVFSLLWIYCSDVVLAQLIRDHELLTHLSIFKGFLFVLVSAILLQQLIGGYVRKLVSATRQVWESEERFQVIFAGFSDAVFIQDDQGVILDLNPTACTMYGFSRNELLGGHVSLISAGQAPYSSAEAERHLKRSAAGQQLFEWQARHKDGHLFWVEVSMRRINLQGQDRVLAIVRDVTERKRAQARLRESENLFETAFRVSPDWMTINRLRDDSFLQVNEGFSKLTGYARDETIGRTAQELGLWDDPLDRERLLAGLRETGAVDHLEARFRDQQGEVQIGLVSARRIEFDGEPCYLCIVRDMTARRWLEQQNIRSAQLASIGQLAAGVAHEINNPINGVINYAQLLVNRTPTTKTNDEILGLIIKEAERVAVIVRELLNFSRDSHNQFRRVSLADLVDSVLTLVRKYIEQHGIRIEIDLEPGLPAIKVIPQKIEQVLINLMNNARYALDRKYPEPHPDKLLRLQARQMAGAEVCRLVVRDQGCGIPAELLHRIEEPFFTTKGIGEGTGLGMSICREIVLQHRGEMHVASVWGEYTEITIDLPLPSAVGTVGGTPES